MTTPPRFRFADFVQLVCIVALAAILRVGYVRVATDDGVKAPTLVVQGEGPRRLVPAEPSGKTPTEFRELVARLASDQVFACRAPLADKEEPTAHVAPGYYWLAAQLGALTDPPDAAVRWLQCVLGSLAAGCLFFFARRAFDSDVVALITGLLAAIHPFWIVNTAELSDGVVATFLLAAVLALGARGSQSGGAFTSLLYGLTLAALAMVRAALLPMAIVALLWFLYRCRQVRFGWFNAILAFLGFANGLAPWAVRNWHLFDEPVPIVTSTYLHLWIGNNPAAMGGPMDDAAVRKTVSPERLKELLDEPNQAKRYAALGHDALDELARDPSGAVTRRWQAGMKFFVGDEWFRNTRMSRHAPEGGEDETAAAPEWLSANVEGCLQGSLLVLMILAGLGWRWSYAWKTRARLATLALCWLPLPYLLSHADELSGPRLPWDAVLICFAAYALAHVAPLVRIRTEEDAE